MPAFLGTSDMPPHLRTALWPQNEPGHVVPKQLIRTSLPEMFKVRRDRSS